jgi:hypothetical protein
MPLLYLQGIKCLSNNLSKNWTFQQKLYPKFNKITEVWKDINVNQLSLILWFHSNAAKFKDQLNK